MSKLKKMICLLITTLLFCTFSICTFASNETSEDSIQIQIATDKAEYKALEIAEITATITNTGAEQIENVTAQVVFNDLAPVAKRNSETRKSVDVLKAGESISFTYNATLNKEEHDLNIFQKIFLWLIRLFNGGYTATNNSIDVVAENVTDIIFGKFTAKNVVQVGYSSINSDNNHNNEKAKEMSEVDSSLNTFLNSDKYKKLETIDDRKDAVEEILLDLSDKGLIKKESISYHDEIGMFYFEYNSGISSGIYLKPIFNSNIGGIENKNNSSNVISNTYNSQDDIETLSVLEKKWNNSILCYGWDNITTSTYSKWNDTVNNCNQRNMNMGLNYAPRVQDYKSILLKKDFICIAEHGSKYPIDNNNYVYCFAVYGESVTEDKNSNIYSQDIAEQRIYVVYDGTIYEESTQKGFYVIVPEFFKHYYGGNSLSGSIIYLSSCMGFGESEKLDNTFAKTFVNECGASAVVGFCNSVWLDYANDFLNVFTSNLTAGKSISTSFNDTVSFCGSSDKEYVELYGDVTFFISEKGDGLPAFPILFENLSAITGTVTDSKTGNPISNVTVEVIDNESGSLEPVKTAITDTNGKYSLELPYGSYSLSFNHENYEYYGTSLSVNYEAYEENATLSPKGNSGDDNTGDSGETEERTVIDSGDCGANVTWTLYEDGELVISGSGEMSSSPWNNEDIKNVIISDGVKSIIGNAFDRCNNLASVTIGNSVTHIGDCAFRYCENLTEIIIPDSVTTIGDSTFFYCKNLSSAIIGNGVSTIGQWAFSDCSNLEYIKFGQNLNAIYDDVFSNCSSLTDVYAKDIDSWLSISFSTAKSNPMSYANNLYFNNALVKDITIPSNISSIGDYTFYCCENINSVFIPNSITTIGTKSFYGCSELKSISIPDSVTLISEGAFANCNNLTSVELSENLSSLESECFGWCYNLKEITIPNNVNKIDDWAFYLCENLTNVTIGEKVKTIGEKAFQSTGITSIIIPDSVTTIENDAFLNCENLISVDIGKNVSTMGDNPFYYCYKLQEFNVDLANNNFSNDEIGVLFNKEKTLLIRYPQGNTTESYIMPNTVTEIVDEAFYNSDNLVSITISNNVTSIGGFGNCGKLKTVILGNNISLIENTAFYGCYFLENIIIPKSITEIGNMAFYYCMNLKDVYYEGTEEEWNAISIGDNAFYRGNEMYSTIHYNS